MLCLAVRTAFVLDRSTHAYTLPITYTNAQTHSPCIFWRIVSDLIDVHSRHRANRMSNASHWIVVWFVTSYNVYFSYIKITGQTGERIKAHPVKSINILGTIAAHCPFRANVKELSQSQRNACRRTGSAWIQSKYIYLYIGQRIVNLE